jgi:hypothetical protein
VTEEEVLYLEFLESMQEAEAELEQDLVKEVRKDGADGARWVLAKRFRAYYGNSLEVVTREGEKARQYEIEWPDMDIDVSEEQPESAP